MIKVIFDRTVSLIALLVLCPLMVLVAVAIKVKMSDGSVLFCQQRIGLHGVPFVIYKFRTMSSLSGGSSISVAGESRITPLGAFLRRYKLDELPELWNVLKGDMSFVGPRPDVPGYADQLQGEARKILELRPGITGPASLKYRDEEYLLQSVALKGEDPQRYNDEMIFPDKVRLNLFYYHHPSLLTDLKMILCTVFHLKMEYAQELI